MNAVIALHLGAGDEKKANMAATIGTVLSMVHAVILTIAGIAIMPGFLRMFTSSETVIDLGDPVLNDCIFIYNGDHAGSGV